MRRELADLPDGEAQISTDALWWPPAKIVGRYLAPYLASLAGMETAPELLGHSPEAITVEVELDPDGGAVPAMRLQINRLIGKGEGERVTISASVDPLIVRPEDTLGEAAERMLKGAQTSAVVCDYGRIIGILTTADFVRACATRMHSSEARVREWMTAEPLAVPIGTSLAEAEFLMCEYGVHHLVVVKGERPVGVLHDLSQLTRDPAVDELASGRAVKPS